MSVLSVLSVRPGRDFDVLAEYGNSFGFAPALWSALSVRYLSSDAAWLFNSAGLHKLYDDPKVPAAVRRTFGLTFDRVYVKAEHFAQAAKDIDEMLTAYPEVTGHWRAVKRHFEEPDGATALGFKVDQADELWQGQWDEESEAYGPPDWSKFYDPYDYDLKQ